MTFIDSKDSKKGWRNAAHLRALSIYLNYEITYSKPS